MKTFFLFNLDQNNVVPNLADTAPGDNVFTYTPGEKTKSTRTGYDQSSNLAGFAIEFQINRAAETATGAGIDYFFLP